MSSPIWSALAKLDGSLQAIQSQVDRVRAGLEMDGDQLGQTLQEARRHAATVRDLIRAESPDASWKDRADLELLIQQLELAAQERRDQQRRIKLMELANELEAGRVKYRLEARAATLNTLRLEAVRQLRTEAARAQEVRDLPGPNASEWLHWACHLQDERDAVVLAILRMDFAALEGFAAEIEESYWIPGQSAQESLFRFPEPSSPTAPEPTTDLLAPSSATRMTAVAAYDDKLPQAVKAQFEKATQAGNYSEALSLCYERQPGEASLVPENSEGATPWRAAAVAEASVPSAVPTQAASRVNHCELCGCSYRGEFHVCPISCAAARLTSAAVPAVTRNYHPVHEEFSDASIEAATASEACLDLSLPTGREASPEPGVPQLEQAPGFDPSGDSAGMEFERLKAIVGENYSLEDEASPSFREVVAAKRPVIAWVATVCVALLAVILAVIYHWDAAVSSKPDRTVATANPNLAGVVQDSDIQKDIEQRLEVLKGSSIQVMVQDGAATLLGRASSQEDVMKAAALASQADGVKSISNKIQAETGVAKSSR